MLKPCVWSIAHALGFTPYPFEFADCRLIKSLDRVAIRIGKVERIAAVPMLFGSREHLAAQLFDVRSQIAVHLIDCLGAIENHSDVIEELGLRWLVGREFIS